MTSGSLNKKSFHIRSLVRNQERESESDNYIYVVKSSPANFSCALFLSIKHEIHFIKSTDFMILEGLES